jgi:hypothetical protein
MPSAILVQVMQKQVLVFSMMSTGANTSQTICNNLNLVLFSSSHDAHETLLTTEHPTWSAPIDGGKCRGIVPSVLSMIGV